MSEEDEDGLWIKTEPSLDGSTYVVTVEINADRSMMLTPDSARRYASTILEAVARAEYDAAIYAQFDELPDKEAVARLIKDLRKDRPDIDTSATEPLVITPGVTRDGKPFLTVNIEGKAVGQWTIPDAREHALAAMEAVLVADLDSGYYRALTGLLTLDEDRARRTIQDLHNYRHNKQ